MNSKNNISKFSNFIYNKNVKKKCKEIRSSGETYMEDTNILYFTEKERDIFFQIMDNSIKHEKNPNEKRRWIRNKALYAVLYYCGLRVSEGVKMETSAYNVKRHEIYCERIKGSKNNKLIIMPDYEWVEEALKKHIKVNSPGKYLFTKIIPEIDQPLSRKTCDMIMRNICSQTDIPREKWHCSVLRNSIAMELKAKGLNVMELQYWLGHESISNTAIYYSNEDTQSTESLYEKLFEEQPSKKEGDELNSKKEKN